MKTQDQIDVFKHVSTQKNMKTQGQIEVFKHVFKTKNMTIHKNNLVFEGTDPPSNAWG